MEDPDVPGTRYHTVIFVETNADESGFIHHVTGDLVGGMEYERKSSRRPEDSQTFYQKELLGSVLAAAYPESVDGVCRNQRPPPPQKAFNRTTKRTEPVKPDGSFYTKHEARPRLVKCTEWTENQAIPALRQAQVLETSASTSSTARGSATASAGSSRQGSRGSEWIWFPQHRRYGRQLADGNWVWS